MGSEGVLNIEGSVLLRAFLSSKNLMDFNDYVIDIPVISWVKELLILRNSR